MFSRCDLVQMCFISCNRFRQFRQRHRNCQFNLAEVNAMIRKLKSGEYRLYSKKKDSKSGKRKNLGTFKSREAAEKHEREVQYFKKH